MSICDGLVSQPDSLPSDTLTLADGLLVFAYDKGCWGGYHVGYFTSAEDLDRELKRADDQHSFLESPAVYVMIQAMVVTLERFVQENFPDLDVAKWSVPQRKLLKLEQQTAKLASDMNRLVQVNRPVSRKRKRPDDEKNAEDEEEDDWNDEQGQAALLAAIALVWTQLTPATDSDVPEALFLQVDKGLTGVVTCDCAEKIPGDGWWCLRATNKFVSCESEEFMEVKL